LVEVFDLVAILPSSVGQGPEDEEEEKALHLSK